MTNEEEKIEKKIMSAFLTYSLGCYNSHVKATDEIKQLLTQAEERGYQRALEDVEKVLDKVHQEHVDAVRISQTIDVLSHIEVLLEQLKQKSGGYE